VNDNELTHIHRFGINLHIVSLFIQTMRTGDSTNVSLSFRAWRCAISLSLFYLGGGHEV
jgi:hypothetical protein